MDAPSIPGLQLVELIGHGAQSVVYRAYRGDTECAVKILRPEQCSEISMSTLRGRREAAALARIHHRGLADIMSVGEHQRQLYLVMEYVRGETLTERLANGPLAEEEAAGFTKQLAEALAQVHLCRLVHGDIKPQNIIISEQGQARLIDFGVVMPHRELQDHDVVVGTFRYCAPEQAGVLRCAIDGRADLYSLGIVLFQMLTGETPFQGFKPAELILQHATQKPPDLRQLNPRATNAIAGIVAKLLEKEPDARYQSGFGLAEDLGRLAALNHRHSQRQPYVLGESDGHARFDQDLGFVGRRREMEQLEACWRRAGAGNGGLVVVRGQPGSGKSRLVQELLKQAGDDRLILSGKCSSDEIMPYAPIRELIDKFLVEEQVVTDPQRQLQLRRAAGDGAAYLKRLSPGLSQLFCDQPDADAGEDVQEQFYQAAADLVASLSHEFNGGLLFIDDAHWLDSGSCRILHRLLRQLDSCPLLVLFTLRSDVESATCGDLWQQREGLSLHTVDLPPLGEKTVDALIQLQLGSQQFAPELTTFVAARSGGNALAVEQLLQAMIEGGQLGFLWGRWCIDSQGLEALQLPSTLLELIVQRLHKLDSATLSLLGTAALLGNRFRLDILQAACGYAEEAFVVALGQAAQAQVIEPAPMGGFCFIHDRLREALLEDLSAKEAKKRHATLAQALIGLQVDDTEVVYALAQHSYHAVEKGWRQRAFDANRAAADRAQSNFAYEQAFVFYQQAAEIAQRFQLTTDQAFEHEYAEICARTGRFALAIERAEGALEGVTHPSLRAKLRLLLSRVHLREVGGVTARRAIEQSFGELKLRYPQASLWYVLRAVLGFVAGLLRVPKVRTTAATKGPDTQYKKMLVDIYQQTALTAYYEVEPLTMFQCILDLRRVVAELGPSRQYAIWCSGASSVAAIVGLKRLSLQLIDRSISVSQEVGDPVTLAKVNMYRGFTWDFLGDPLQAAQVMEECLDRHGKWLESVDCIIVCATLAWNLMARGHTEQALQVLERAHVWSIELDWFAAPALALLGRVAEGKEVLNRFERTIEETPDARWRWGQFLAHKACFLQEIGDHGQEFEKVVASFGRLGLGPAQAPLQMTHYYVAVAKVRLAQLQNAEPQQAQLARLRLEKALKTLKTAITHPLLTGFACYLGAALELFRGREHKALSLLKRAEKIGQAIDNPLLLYDVMTLRAQLAKKRKQPDQESVFARRARAMASQRNWHSKVSQVGRDHVAVLGDATAEATVESTGVDVETRPLSHLPGTE